MRPLVKICAYVYGCGMGIVISLDGRFEWEYDKDVLNKENHGFHFNEILDAFDDQFFLEAYDWENSTSDEVRWKGIASFDCRIYFFISYTERKGRTRIISARLAMPLEKEHYDENYRKQIAGYE
jgi:uncharacterized DUF497 family protein